MSLDNHVSITLLLFLFQYIMAKKLIIRKRRGRVLKVKRPSTEVNMTVDEDVEQREQEEEQQQSRREIFKAQAAEWKTMKSQVAKLKAERTKLGNKQRESKKLISKKIKSLISETRTKQDTELKAMGLVPPAREDQMDVSDNE